jgi:hypothetical protein
VNCPIGRPRGYDTSAAFDQHFTTKPPALEFQHWLRSSNERPGQEKLVLVQVRDPEVVHFAKARTVTEICVWG